VVPRDAGHGSLTPAKYTCRSTLRASGVHATDYTQMSNGARGEALPNIRTGGCVEMSWRPEPV
jgi:hypothetical protein